MKNWQLNLTARGSVAILCALILPLQQMSAYQQQAQPQGAQAALLGPDQLDSLVAPIALYPDPLLSQVLVASTYPLEIVEAGRWLKANTNLQGKQLADAATKQSWDASIQAMVAFPDVLKQLDDNITWTTDLGNAFLAQESDVMSAVQRLRQKAQQNGKLTSSEQQKVVTAKENNVTYIEIQPSNPQVIYVPSYNPTVIWGAPPVYAYPPIYYPPYSAGAVVAASAISFGVGMAVGAMWGGGGGWGWGCGWGHGSVNINNNFIRQNNFNRTSISNSNRWQHNSAHRSGVPYSNRNVANRYNGGGNRAQQLGNRPTANQTQQRLNQANRGNLNQGNRANQGNRGNVNQANRGNAGQSGQSFRQNQGSGQNRQNAQNRQAGGGDKIGNRQAGGNPGAGRSAFDGRQGGQRSQMSSNRGRSSYGGGGGHRGGGRRR
jgi:Protein of unknown function (DUF3300)